MIKASLFFLITVFVSCSSSLVKKTKNNRYIIINKEINALVSNSTEGSVLLEKHLNQYFADDLESLIFNEDRHEYHFLTTTHSLSKEDFKLLFNKNQINLYKQQLHKNEVLTADKINQKKIILTDLKYPQKVLSFYNDKSLIVLSNPMFTVNGEYAIIGYFIGDYHRNMGDQGFSIYKKEKGRWVLFKRILYGIS